MGNMTITALLISIVAMGVITLVLRAFPTFVPRRILNSHLLRYLNYALPLSVMTVLIVHSMGINYENFETTMILSKVGALLLVLLSYIWIKNVFLSVIIGVASLNGLLYLWQLF